MKTNPRIKRMTSKYLSGISYAQIGIDEGISRERVRQLLKPFVNSKDGGRYLAGKKAKKERLLEREERYKERFGCSFEEYKKIPVDIRRAYTVFCQNQRRFGKTVNLTLIDWYTTWEESGKWSLHGRNKFVMAVTSTTNIVTINDIKVMEFGQRIREAKSH